jgi:type IV pilus assembly protein PilB
MSDMSVADRGHTDRSLLEKSKLAQILDEKGLVDRSVLINALYKMAETGEETPRSLAQILVYKLNIAHEIVFGTLAEMYAFRKMEIDLETLEQKQITQTKDLLSKFPDDFKKKLLYKKVFPYKIQPGSRDSLLILAADPTDKVIHEISSQTSFRKYEVVYCPLKNLDEVINKIAPQKNEFLQLLEEAGELLVDSKDSDSEIDEHELDDEINKSLLVNLFEGSLIEAVRKNASDVHIVPSSKTSVDICFRIDGKLQLWFRQENTPPEAYIAVIKDRSIGIDRFERDSAQDGFAQRLIDDHIIRFRVSVLPIVSAEYERRFESIVIRVIDDRKVVTDFKKLGFQEQAEKEFVKSISTSKGIIVVTGPTGSGKSTTLMAALHHVINPTLNVLTVEDPVEYVIHGARQLKISHRMTFEEAIRSILRHDPDVVMVGEIRDKTTAEIAVKLANTGHLTFSTLHTNDAPSAISRLYKMGIEPFLLAYSINIIIAQRLVRQLCHHCKKPLSKEYWPAALELGMQQEDLDKGLVFEEVGCPKCSNGFKGRINIAEALYFYPDIRESIVKAGNEIDEDKIRTLAEKHGMLTMRQSGLARIRDGLTTLSEVAYATSGDD